MNYNKDNTVRDYEAAQKLQKLIMEMVDEVEEIERYPILLISHSSKNDNPESSARIFEIQVGTSLIKTSLFDDKSSDNFELCKNLLQKLENSDWRELTNEAFFHGEMGSQGVLLDYDGIWLICGNINNEGYVWHCTSERRFSRQVIKFITNTRNGFKINLGVEHPIEFDQIHPETHAYLPTEARTALAKNAEFHALELKNQNAASQLYEFVSNVSEQMDSLGAQPILFLRKNERVNSENHSIIENNVCVGESGFYSKEIIYDQGKEPDTDKKQNLYSESLNYVSREKTDEICNGGITYEPDLFHKALNIFDKFDETPWQSLIQEALPDTQIVESSNTIGVYLYLDEVWILRDIPKVGYSHLFELWHFTKDQELLHVGLSSALRTMDINRHGEPLSISDINVAALPHLNGTIRDWLVPTVSNEAKESENYEKLCSLMHAVHSAVAEYSDLIVFGRIDRKYSVRCSYAIQYQRKLYGKQSVEYFRRDPKDKLNVIKAPQPVEKVGKILNEMYRTAFDEDFVGELFNCKRRSRERVYVIFKPDEALIQINHSIFKVTNNDIQYDGTYNNTGLSKRIGGWIYAITDTLE